MEEIQFPRYNRINLYNCEIFRKSRIMWKGII